MKGHPFQVYQKENKNPIALRFREFLRYQSDQHHPILSNYGL